MPPEQPARSLRIAPLLMGAFVWSFVLAIPWLHVHGGLPGGDPLRLAALGAPLVALIAGAALGSDALLLLAFPLLLLPPLLTDAALTGRRVYGLEAWIATACLLVLYLVAVVRAGVLRAPRSRLGITPAGRALVVLHGLLSVAILCVLVVLPAAGDGLLDAFERSHGPDARAARAAAVAVGVLVWAGTLLRLQLPALLRMLRHAPMAHDPLCRELEEFRVGAMNARSVRADLGWALILGGLAAMALGWIMVR